MGNYWEPADQEFGNQQDSATYGFVAPSPAPEQLDVADANEAAAPVDLHAHGTTSDEPERRGGNVSQYGGPGRPTGSGDYGHGGSGDGGDDRYTAPFHEQGGGDPYDDDRPPFGYQEDERYWTDYLRIAAPVVGVIVMLALVWFWVANMLGGDEENFDNNGDEDVAGPVIAETPETTENESEDDPISVTTPESDETTEDGNGNGNGEGDNGDGDEPTPTTLGPGATAVVVGTGEAGLNVRAEPTTDSDVVGSIPDGTEMTITGESEQADGFTWWPIDTDELTGFVAEDFIELNQ